MRASVIRVILALWLGACGAPAASPGDGSNDGGGGGSATIDARGGAAAIDAAGATPADAAIVVGSAGCGHGGVATGLGAHDLSVAGVSRHYQLFVPAGYDASVPTRLVFVFHGLGGNGSLIRAYFGFEAEAAGHALFVYPDGLPVQGGQTGWSTSDLAFFDAMRVEIEGSYCVDPARVFATGHSFGGYMSNLIGCARSDVVRAIAPVSGGLLAACTGGPVAAWIAHGDADMTVNQSEGIAARDRWIATDGCATTSHATDPAPCVGYDGCKAGKPVTWCSFAGGHYPLPAFIKPAIWKFLSSF
jgi:polyhydroxybutyrate depolymerase